jgi:hypothetical protein
MGYRREEAPGYANGVLLPEAYTGRAVDAHFVVHRHSFESMVPRYSTHIAAAWTVLEKVSGDWQIHGGGMIAVVKLDDAHDCVGVEVRADTLPLAICRAALEAVA